MAEIIIKAVKIAAGRRIPFEMDFGLATRLSEKYSARLRDLVGKELTLDETEVWENVRVNLLRHDIQQLKENPLYVEMSFMESDYMERLFNTRHWDVRTKRRLSKYLKSKEVKVSYIIVDILRSYYHPVVINGLVGYKSILHK
jgi:hypothetical protein